MPYLIRYSPSARDHLRALTARQQQIVLDAVDRQLASQPDLETRNRKPMRPNPLAPWELRIGNLRVYYEFSQEPEPVVTVLAIGKKLRNRVVIGDKEIEL